MSNNWAAIKQAIHQKMTESARGADLVKLRECLTMRHSVLDYSGVAHFDNGIVIRFAGPPHSSVSVSSRDIQVGRESAGVVAGQSEDGASQGDASHAPGDIATEGVGSESPNSHSDVTPGDDGSSPNIKKDRFNLRKKDSSPRDKGNRK